VSTILRYKNPVWPDYFADPFVLRTAESYFAYGTSGPGSASSEGHFTVLRSEDLTQWTEVGKALITPAGYENGSFWAPEVAENRGVYYMYYSAGGPEGENHRLRVATADRPEGPFRDRGVMLFPDEPFSIDASPFQDPKDGRWYLFFARDYFDEPAGTGLSVVPLADDMVTVTGPPTPLIRATADWQVFERNRLWYDKVWPAWHTVEGPFAVAYDGRYYLFYSGGLWKGASYGVGVGVADSPLGPYVEADASGGPTVLRGLEGEALGPGHNSVVLGPDGKTHFMVYHAWDPAYGARRMFIDPIEWTPNGPICLGPTVTEQVLELA
jgi:GH43 family beta-xylosidase